MSTENNPIIIEFKNVGTTTWTVPSNVNTIEYLIVAGGGSGGGGYDTGAGGGGGAGQVKTGFLNVLSGTTYNVTVGDGGPASITDYINGPKETNGNTGGNSSFGNIISYGGFGGYRSRENNGVIGRGGFIPNNDTGAFAGSGGANGSSTTRGSSGGGGGNNSNGGNGTSTAGGIGGSGIISNISGISIEYGKGGNGARGNTRITGSAGLNNTGNGGNGGSYNSGGSAIGGKGGSGIIIIKYFINPPSNNNNNNLLPSINTRPIMRMFGIDMTKNHKKGYSRGIQNSSFGTLGNRRR